MLSKLPVLPNFIRSILFVGAATFSVGAFAEHHGAAEEKIGDLKDMTTSETALTAEEIKAIKTKSSMTEGKVKNTADEVSEEELAKKAESMTPEN